MKKLVPVIFVIAAMLVAPAMGFAGEPSPWTEEDTYGNKVVAKLDYGVKNFLGGWTELFRAPQRAKEAGDGMLDGIGQGLINTVAYTVGGAIHTATFLCPWTDVPIKDGGVQF